MSLTSDVNDLIDTSKPGHLLVGLERMTTVTGRALHLAVSAMLAELSDGTTYTNGLRASLKREQKQVNELRTLCDQLTRRVQELEAAK